MIILSMTVIFTYLALSAHGKQLHEHMTYEEIESVFNVKHDSIDSVDYEVLEILHARNPREIDRLDAYMKTTNHEYLLYLEENKVLLGSDTPIYKAKYNISNKRPYYSKTFYSDYFPEGLELYHDYENQAAFAVHTDENNHRHFDGVIGESVHIRSLPDRLHKELKRNYSALLETSPGFTNPPRELIVNNSTYHVIINKSYNTTDNPNNNNNNNAQEMKIRQHPRTYEKGENNTLYPEILIVNNLELHTDHHKSSHLKIVAKYIAAYWNAVDLRFRELTDPKVKLNIAGLITSEDPLALPYMTEIKLTDDEGDYYNAIELLRNTDKFFLVNETKIFPTDSYDIIVTMTLEKLKRRGFFFDVEGIANVPGACSAHRTAAVRDISGFATMIITAHELGHSFGAVHDLVETDDDCKSENGFIMTSAKGKNQFRWSRCSKEEMRAFFNTEHANCLKNKPYIGSLYPKLLPGTLQDRDKQCYRRFGTHASNHTKYGADCKRLWCELKRMEKGHYFTYPDFAPAEGTSCGINKICLDGTCVDDSPSYHSTNSIWDHSIKL